MHDGNWTVSPALGRRVAVKLVRWGRRGGGLRFRGWGEGSFQGEGDLAPTRYELGGKWEGSGTMSYGRICLKCEGELQFYPCL